MGFPNTEHKEEKNAKFSKLPNSVNSVVILHQPGNILTPEWKRVSKQLIALPHEKIQMLKSQNLT